MANTCSYDDMHHVQQELTSEDKRYVEVHLNETDEARENAIAEIKRWIEESDDLRARIDDFLILRFLRVCKFDLEKTKIRMRNYYKQRSDLPEWFMNKDPFRSELQELLDLGLFLPMREPDNQERLVIIMHGTRHDPRIHKISDIFKVCVMITEVAMKYYAAATIYGCAVFIDVASPTIRHILQFRPHIIMNIVHAWQSCYPLRFQSINIFNVPSFFEVIVRIFKSFMTKKMKSRFHVYSDGLHCFKDIPANILPVEYGGTDSTCQELAEYWKKLTEENRDWILDDEKDEISILK